MKRIVSLVTLVVAILFVACDKDNSGVQKFAITTGTEYDVEMSGGDVYVIYSGVTDVTITILRGEDAIREVKKPAVGVIVVAFNANTSGVTSTAVVEARSGDDFYTLVFTQAGGDEKAFNALSLDGYYYGQKYGKGADRYSFFLSDKGLNNGGQAYTDGTYYYVDAFAPVTNSASVPHGTYLFDGTNGGKPFTINSKNSQLIITGKSVEDTEVKYLSDAKMVVTENKIVLEVVIDGKSHKVVYNGGLELDDATSESGDNNGGQDDPTGGQDKESQSTLTADHHVTFDGEHRAKWVYEKDYWQTGYSNYTIMIMNKANGYVFGETLQLDIITNNTSQDGDFYGTYQCSQTPTKGVMMAGFTDNTSKPVGSWLFDYTSGGASYNGYAMIVGGSVTISNNGDGTSTVILDGCDYKGNKITCNWTGIIEKE